MSINTRKRKRCCFAGHSRIYDKSLKKNLEEKICELVEIHNVEEFWVGDYGNFDSYSAIAVNALKKEQPHIKLNLILPYITKTIEKYKKSYYEKYDNILIADIPENTPHRYKIIKTNQYMVDNSDYLICYVAHDWGGASQTLRYAGKKDNIIIFNLAECGNTSQYKNLFNI